MKQRGRPSAVSLETLTSPIQVVERPAAPHDLNDEEVEVWAKVISSQPADWFDPGNLPLLTQYSRHVVQARRLAELVERATSDPDLSLQSYDRLLIMQDRESKAIANLATKMRISQQATTNHRGNRKPTSGRKLWEG
jgi:hypothetical protein